MTPILGIMASQISGHLVVPNNYESIATTTLTTAAATIDFTSIPATYKHLQIRVMSQDSRNTPINRLTLRVGSGSIDTGANYAYHYLSGDGATVSSSYDLSTTRIPAGYSYSTTSSSIFGVGVWDIFDYANTNKKKTIRILSGADSNGGGELAIASGAWFNTAAIDTLQFYSNNAGNLTTYTSIALYGVK